MKSGRGMFILGMMGLATVAGAANNALQFDGVNDYVTFGSTSTLGTSNLTVEVWFKRTGAGVGTNTGTGGVTDAIPLVAKGRSEGDGSNVDMNYILAIRASDNLLVADFEDSASGANHPVVGVTPIVNGVWYHAAATYNGSQWKLYLNGNLETTSAAINQPPRWDSIQHAALGSALNSTGVASGFFAGILDEARIWNYARTAQQVADCRNVEITSAPGLIGRWSLNEGLGTTATSSSGSGVVGTLTNGPAWVPGFQPTITTLIAQGDTWKYFKGLTMPVGAWNGIVYDDSLWLTGPGSIGYGDNDDGTVLTDMSNGYEAIFMRKPFTVADPTAIAALVLGADYDDGFVAYVNGVEVARRNMPAGTPTEDTLATPTHEASNGDSTPQPKQYINISTNSLVAGVNVLAISAHNSSLPSSDLTTIFDLTSSIGTVTRGPYLQIGSQTNMTVRWRTDYPTTSRVRYGNALGNLVSSVQNLTLTTEHEIKLTGLTPDTQYYYSAGSTVGVQAGDDDDHFFRTAPAIGTPQHTRIWAVGDFGAGDANEIKVLNAFLNFIGANFTDVILMLGDNAYETGTDTEFTNGVFTPYQPILRQSVSWPCVGNHETNQSTTFDAGIPYYQSFTLPTQAEAGGFASGTEQYYSFDHGDIHFINLDSQTSSRSPGSAMLTWLAADLAATNQKWIIAYWHHPPYSKGSHNSDTDTQLVEMRENILPILEANGVDLVLCGHSHVYERSKFIDGFYATPTLAGSGTVIDAGNGREDGTGSYQKNLDTPHSGTAYIVTGSGGKLSGSWVGGSTATTNPTPHPVMIVSLRVLGSVAIDVNGDRLDAKFIQSNGTVQDYFTMIKGATLNVVTGDAFASETNVTDTANMVISRTGATNTVLTVNYTLGGTAGNGTDYNTLLSQLSLPKGVASTNIVVTVIPDTLAEGDETVTLSLTPAATYQLGVNTNTGITIKDKPMDEWRFLKFGPNANNAGIACDTCDPDSDGIPNLTEYGLGSDPNVVSVANLPQPSIAGGYLTLSYTRPSPPPDVTYTGEAGSESVFWPDAVIQLGIPNNGNGTETVQFRDNVLVNDAAKRFLRLKIGRSP